MKTENFAFTCISKPLARICCTLCSGSRISRLSQTKFRYAHSYGFTLAETLLVLSILGIIATIVIPLVQQKWQDTYTVSAVRMAYTTIDKALNQLVVENRSLSSLEWPEKEKLSASGDNPSTLNREYFAKEFFKYFNTSKLCEDYTCAFVARNSWKRLDNNLVGDGGTSTYTTFFNSSAALKNGMSISVGRIKKDQVKVGYNPAVGNIYKNLWGYIFVDINGKKGPNRYGYDMFFFQIGDNGIDLSFSRANSKNDCNKNYNSGTYTGFSCATWIMKHGNVDYKYRDVSSEW